MTSSRPDTGTSRDSLPSTAASLAHVRWIAGGTGSGKSTLARLLAARHGLPVYDGDLAEHRWLTLCTPEQHPYLSALRDLPPGAMWDGRTADEVLRAMPSMHGEMLGFVVDDLLAMPTDRIVLVDYFGILPADLAPLLSRPGQAVFLLPTAEFRRDVLRARYADPQRARATWGGRDPSPVLAERLARDALWDAEVRAQAAGHPLDVLTVDGATPAADLAERVAARFGLDPGA
ncbi:hypothetical protein ACFV4G_04410 [Kitasatospora sp. NPDC059747]|uniref:hypothetical protein n=1 Tax=Kitasatospora sp. NPDC059747 TaxID=3346930 RepID=UPI003647BD93